MLHSSSPLSLPFSPEKPLDNSRMIQYIYIFALLIGRPKGAMPKSHTQVDARNAKIDTSSRLIKIDTSSGYFVATNMIQTM